MTFQSPWAFFLLLLIPIYFFLRKLNILQKPSITTVLSDWNGTPFNWNSRITKFFFILSKILIYSTFVLSIIALSDPVYKHQDKIFTSRGTDILFVLDNSPSMVANDVNGKTRLEASRDAIDRLFMQKNGTRYGIVTMGSEAAVLVPPTNDFNTFHTRLQSITAGTMGERSAIGTGIATAVYHLVSSAAPKKCIVLFTDGENNAGEIHPDTAAELAQKNNITLYVFGVGSKGTVSVKYTDPVSGNTVSGYLDSNFDSTSLRNIANIGHGKYFEASTFDQLVLLLDSISNEESMEQDFIYKSVFNSYYKKILWIVLILFGLAWFVTRFLLRYKKIIFFRTVCFSIAFIFLLISFFDISWGTRFVPVFKSINSVSFVFDISNSMEARDEEGRNSRLNAASIFATKLLNRMNNTPVSVVLSKGDGIIAIPQTEDYVMVQSLLDSLSPNLMTSPGTDLSKGILAAKDSFPNNISSACHIWVFTDGEETENHLSTALTECIRKGINVKIIGFGTKEGYDITSGDGKTIVHSSLQTEAIEHAVETAIKKIPQGTVFSKPEFLLAGNKGSGSTLLNSLKPNKNSDSYLTFEEESISRYKFFLTLALVFFILGVFFSELTFPAKRKHLFSKLLFFSFVLILSGCSSDSKGFNSNSIKKTFKGNVFYKQNEFQKAAGEFFETYETAVSNQNQALTDYALYNISTAYFMTNEKEAALEKLQMISSEASPQVKFNAFFNAGVILYQKGDKQTAAEYFKEALKTDSSKIEAKINLELCQKQTEILSNESEAQMLPSSDSDFSDFNDLEKTVFERIKENDTKQWKNSETIQTNDLSKDY